MEEKRILWVSAAVGIFLLIVIGAALMLYAPHKNGNSVSAQNDTEWILTPQGTGAAFTETPQNEAPAHPAGTAPAILPSDVAAAHLTDNLSGTAPAAPNTTETGTIQSNDLTIISNNTTVFAKDQVTTIDLTATGKPVEQRVIEAPAGSETAPDVKTVVPANETRQIYSTDTKVQTGKTQSTARTAAKPKNTAASPAKPAKPVSIPDRYWVQAASFTNKDNAESARSILANEKIPAEVFTYQNGGKTYYRLRVGPYTTASEAEYWNSRIKLIDHFSSAQSYVTNSSKPIR